MTHAAAPAGEPAGESAVAPGVSAATLRRVEHAAGGLATRSVALMDERLVWFRHLPADQRSWVTLVAQAGISGYVSWVHAGGSTARLAEQVFGTAPRDLVRAVSLRRTVELVRLAISVAEDEMPALARDDAERRALRESLLRYSREIAFAAAAVYAAAAETRGAWDARVEAAVVDGIIRGEDAAALASRAAPLNWDTTGPVQVLVGSLPTGTRAEAVAAVADFAHGRHGSPAMAGVAGDRLVVVLGAAGEPGPAVTDLFGAGPLVRGPVATGLHGAVASAADAFAALDVAATWPDAPRPVDADRLLVERTLAGDARARARLRSSVYAPLAAAGGPLPATLRAYVAVGGALEPAARRLFVHPNTMRYRLHRIADLTGLDPWDPRDRLILQAAMVLGDLDADDRPIWSNPPARLDDSYKSM